MENLSDLRTAIDRIDEQLLDLLSQRGILAQEVGRLKERERIPVYAPERAEQLMRRLAARNQGPFHQEAIRAIYREIMSASLALEKNMVIACLGTSAEPTHHAARRQFGSSVGYRFYTDPATLVETIASEEADCGVIPYGSEDLDVSLLESLEEGRVKLCAQILLKDDQTDNQEKTNRRYLVLGRTLNASSGDDQSAYVIHLSKDPSQCALALKSLKTLNIQILSYSSQDSRRGGIYLFIEVLGHATDPALKEAFLMAKSSRITFPAYQLCGSYPRID